MANEEHLNDQMVVRREKMQALRDQGVAPFGHRFDPDHDLSTDIRKKYENDSGELLLAQHNVVTIAGRMIGKRGSGKASFADLLDREARSNSTFAKIWWGRSLQAIQRIRLRGFLGDYW